MAKNRDEIWENPLVPHAVLYKMYDAMLMLRRLSRGAGDQGMLGEEACRASSLLSLQAGDCVSDVSRPPTGDGRAKRSRESLCQQLAAGTITLPAEPHTAVRLEHAIGAASALRAQGGKRMVLAYVEGDALAAGAWKALLGNASRLEAPILFALLPASNERRQGAISDAAQGWGVPGMPVDAADAVALYRVMQESVLRARSGDGPALVECMHWRAPGEAGPADGVEAMRSSLKRRGLLLRRGASRAR